jgi:hypothetical protein
MAAFLFHYDTSDHISREDHSTAHGARMAGGRLELIIVLSRAGGFALSVAAVAVLAVAVPRFTANKLSKLRLNESNSLSKKNESNWIAASNRRMAHCVL